MLRSSRILNNVSLRSQVRRISAVNVSRLDLLGNGLLLRRSGNFSFCGVGIRRSLSISSFNLRRQSVKGWETIDSFERELKHLQANRKNWKYLEKKSEGLVTRMFEYYRERLEIYLHNTSEDQNRLKTAKMSSLIVYTLAILQMFPSF